MAKLLSYYLGQDITICVVVYASLHSPVLIMVTPFGCCAPARIAIAKSSIVIIINPIIKKSVFFGILFYIWTINY